MLGPLTEQHMQLFLKNPRFVGLKFPDMSRPETLQKRFVGKVREKVLGSCSRGLVANLEFVWVSPCGPKKLAFSQDGSGCEMMPMAWWNNPSFEGYG